MKKVSAHQRRSKEVAMDLNVQSRNLYMSSNCGSSINGRGTANQYGLEQLANDTNIGQKYNKKKKLHTQNRYDWYENNMQCQQDIANSMPPSRNEKQSSSCEQEPTSIHNLVVDTSSVTNNTSKKYNATQDSAKEIDCDIRTEIDTKSEKKKVKKKKLTRNDHDDEEPLSKKNRSHKENCSQLCSSVLQHNDVDQNSLASKDQFASATQSSMEIDVLGIASDSPEIDIPGHEEEDFSFSEQPTVMKGLDDKATKNIQKSYKNQNLTVKSKIIPSPTSLQPAEDFSGGEDVSLVEDDITEAADLIPHFQGFKGIKSNHLKEISIKHNVKEFSLGKKKERILSTSDGVQDTDPLPDESNVPSKRKKKKKSKALQDSVLHETYREKSTGKTDNKTNVDVILPNISSECLDSTETRKKKQKKLKSHDGTEAKDSETGSPCGNHTSTENERVESSDRDIHSKKKKKKKHNKVEVSDSSKNKNVESSDDGRSSKKKKKKKQSLLEVSDCPNNDNIERGVKGSSSKKKKESTENGLEESVSSKNRNVESSDKSSSPKKKNKKNNIENSSTPSKNNISPEKESLALVNESVLNPSSSCVKNRRKKKKLKVVEEPNGEETVLVKKKGLMFKVKKVDCEDTQGLETIPSSETMIFKDSKLQQENKNRKGRGERKISCDLQSKEVHHDQLSNNTIVEASPWHRLSHDSNGSFTLTRHNTPTVLPSSGNEPDSFEQMSKASDDMKSQSCNEFSENEAVTSTRGDLIVPHQTSTPQVDSVESSQETNDSQPLVWGRGNLKGLTQKLPSLKSSSGEISKCVTRVTNYNQVAEKANTMEVPVPKKALKQASCQNATQISAESEVEEASIPGRGNLKGLTQKLPPNVDIQDSVESEEVSEHGSSPQNLLKSCNRVDPAQDEGDSDEYESDRSSSYADNNIEPPSTIEETPASKKTRTDNHSNEVPEAIRSEPGRSLKTTLENKFASRSSSSSSCDEDDKADFVDKKSKNNKTLIKKKHRCTRCRTWFKTASEMMRHDCQLVRKKKESPRKQEAMFKCGLCERKYIQKCHLNHHVRTSHQGYRPYTCDSCEMSFSEKQTLIVHMRIHTNTKPYECSVCDTDFKTTSHLHRHYRTYHNFVQKYNCDFCESSYFMKKDLEAHVTRIHNKKCFQTLKSLDGKSSDASLFK